MKDSELLHFIYKRLINMYNEDENFDYMIALSEIIEKTNKKEQKKESKSKWIKWEALENSVCPVNSTLEIKVKLKSGIKFIKLGSSINWKNIGDHQTVIAYKVIK